MTVIKAQVRLREDVPYKQRGNDYILLTVEFEVEDWDEFDESEQEQIILQTAEETAEGETNIPYVAFSVKRVDTRSG